MSKIFISYRREDSADATGRIYDGLKTHFGVGVLVRDVDSILPGCDFREYLASAVELCQVLLVVIGRDWLDIKDAAGGRRLDDPRDFVRIEIEAALVRGIPVIPLMVRGASYPREEQLPPAIKKLAYRNGHPVRPDPDFHHDLKQLIEHLEALLRREPTWFYIEDRRKAGPVPLARLREMVASGRLQRSDMILQVGELKWVEAGSVGELFPQEKPPEGEGRRTPPIDELETDDIMAAFRQAARGRGRMARDELLKGTSLALGYQRLGPRIEEVLRGHLRAAIRRKIIETDGDLVRGSTATMDQYELEDLRATLCSVMRAGRRYEREEVVQAAARYLGFARVTDAVRQSIRSAFNSGIRQGILRAAGNEIWRE